MLFPTYVFALFFLLFTTTLDFTISHAMQRVETPRARRGLLLLSVCSNIGLLGFFKYANFLTAQAGTLLNLGGVHVQFTPLDIILPAGISFYTFQSMSYTVDVYRRRLAPCARFRDFALFVSFFPQLVAGPIERPENILPQLARRHLPSPADFMAGVERILWGLMKKLIFADRLALLVDSIYARPVESLTSPEAWLGSVAFTLQIYLDFSAYTDIAIGTARLLGIRLMENFNYPFLARNMHDVWRRWHISLSTWFRDYVYIPLGGNRLGGLRHGTNLFVTMFLSGLWHGASWTFVGWGVFLASCMIGRQLLRALLRIPGKEPLLRGRLGTALAVALTFIAFTISFVLFRSPDLSTAFRMIGVMFGKPGGLALLAHGPYLFFSLFCLFVLAVHVVRGLRLVVPSRWHLFQIPWVQGARLALWVLLLTFLRVNTEQTFIYFQF